MNRLCDTNGDFTLWQSQVICLKDRNTSVYPLSQRCFESPNGQQIIGVEGLHKWLRSRWN
jgi:hypothetical protein